MKKKITGAIIKIRSKISLDSHFNFSFIYCLGNYLLAVSLISCFLALTGCLEIIFICNLIHIFSFHSLTLALKISSLLSSFNMLARQVFSFNFCAWPLSPKKSKVTDHETKTAAGRY